jgi:hypothetical protein
MFVEKHGATYCRELLGVDLRHGDKDLAGRQVKAICPGLVRDAALILEAVLGKESGM